MLLIQIIKNDTDVQTMLKKDWNLNNLNDVIKIASSDNFKNKILESVKLNLIKTIQSYMTGVLKILKNFGIQFGISQK